MRLEYFQLIDRIVDISIAERVIHTEAAVPLTSTIFEGHFPGYPLMPGVLLIESMAQTAGWLIIAATKFEQMPFLAAVKEAKLRTFVAPGEHLSLTGSLQHEGSGYSVVTVKGTVNSKAVCDATLMFRLIDFPNEQFRQEMHALARRLSFPTEIQAHG
jgi:3-hydroxyacyl-[acyl-carrier-protein] dehydratase